MTPGMGAGRSLQTVKLLLGYCRLPQPGTVATTYQTTLPSPTGTATSR